LIYRGVFFLRKRTIIKADIIVTATLMKPDNEFYERIKNKAKEVCIVGDTRNPGYIVNAVEDSSRIAHEI